MSATNRKKADGSTTKRNDRDLYPTPHWAIRAVMRRLHVSSNVDVVDPCCGDGRILQITKEEFGAKASGWDILPVNPEGIVPGIWQRDSLSDEPWFPDEDTMDFYSTFRRTMIVTNPPFSKAKEFVERALQELPKDPVVMLLPVPFLASEKRFEFNTKHPAHVMVLPKRPSFTPDGHTDAVTYAWFGWHLATSGTYEVLDVFGDQ